MEKNLKEAFEQAVHQGVEEGRISRRNALKIMALASTGTLAFAEENVTDANATEANATPKLKVSTDARIVIIGGGAAGITVAARLKHALDNPNITVIEPSERHVYQPGQTLVGGGIMTIDDLIKAEADVMPSGIQWVKETVTAIDPDNNALTTDKGQRIEYDYLVVAAGLEYQFEKIKGLTADMIGKDGIHSIYVTDKASAMWEAMQSFKGGTAIFTQPSTPIKCGGAPQKIMYLTEDYIRQNGDRKAAQIIFMTPGGKYFGVPAYHEAVVGFVKEKEITTNFNHNLVEVRAAEKVAVFEKKTKVKTYDKELEIEIEEEKIELIESKYDLLHIVPPMAPAKVVAESPLANAKGWMYVDAQTLQSKRYPNVFGVGDLVATPFGKTGGSVRKQAPVVVANMVALMEGKVMEKKYNGYTVCPLITRRGRVMLAEFGYDAAQIAAGEPVTKAMAMPSFPLDPAQERWIWWILKVYMLKPMYWYGMLKGYA